MFDVWYALSKGWLLHSCNLFSETFSIVPWNEWINTFFLFLWCLVNLLVHRSESLTNLFHYFPQNAWDTDTKVIIFFGPFHISFYLRCWQLSVSREVLLCMFMHSVHSCTNTHSQTQPHMKHCTYCFHRRHRLGRIEWEPSSAEMQEKGHTLAWASVR